MTKNIKRLTGLTAAFLLSFLAQSAFAQGNFLTDIPAGSVGMVSGPEIGERIPDFEAYDQNGNLVSLDDVMGPNGAMVVFHRSADW
jgi:hypothetical protein